MVTKRNLLALAVAAALFTPGCTGLDAVKVASSALSDDGGIHASAQVGEEANKQVIGGDQIKTEIDVKADQAEVSHVRQEKTTEVAGPVRSMVVNNKGDIPVWVVLLLLLGWLLPTPTNMWNGFWSAARAKS